MTDLIAYLFALKDLEEKLSKKSDFQGFNKRSQTNQYKWSLEPRSLVFCNPLPEISAGSGAPTEKYYNITMTSNEKSKDSKAIINELAKNKVIEKLVANISPESDSFDNKDLSQLIYLTLLEKPNSLIEDLYSKGELIFYVIRIITKNAYSITSPYYRAIKKFKNKTTDIDEIRNTL